MCWKHAHMHFIWDSRVIRGFKLSIKTQMSIQCLLPSSSLCVFCGLCILSALEGWFRSDGMAWRSADIHVGSLISNSSLLTEQSSCGERAREMSVRQLRQDCSYRHHVWVCVRKTRIDVKVRLGCDVGRQANRPMRRAVRESSHPLLSDSITHTHTHTGAAAHETGPQSTVQKC